jgi:hypothetical protein
MKTKTVWKTLEISCGEEKRKARLLTEWVVKDGKEVLKGAICDNPRLAQEEPYDCAWSCWKLLTRRAPAPPIKKAPQKKKAPPKKKAAPAKKKAAPARKKPRIIRTKRRPR